MKNERENKAKNAYLHDRMLYSYKELLAYIEKLDELGVRKIKQNLYAEIDDMIGSPHDIYLDYHNDELAENDMPCGVCMEGAVLLANGFSISGDFIGNKALDIFIPRWQYVDWMPKIRLSDIEYSEYSKDSELAQLIRDGNNIAIWKIYKEGHLSDNIELWAINDKTEATLKQMYRIIELSWGKQYMEMPEERKAFIKEHYKYDDFAKWLERASLPDPI